MQLNAVIPVPVVLPMLTAAVLSAVGSHLPKKAIAWISVAVVAAMLVVCGVLMRASAGQTIVYWFGNWQPDAAHYPIGVCFIVSPLAAGMAGLVSLLGLAAFVFSSDYFKEIHALFHAMMLVFLAGMCGICLAGDLFNLFVWFELMTVAAVALCGYECERRGPLLGAMNFAVLNALGAFVTLVGISLVYFYTGTLNMAEAGRALAGQPGFVAILFLLTCTGFLVKSAVAPFHFWLADAHAVAPTPVCVLFSGVMVEMGLYALARIYWDVFSPAFGSHAVGVRELFIGIGVFTAIVGAVFSFGQRHFKRLLAFSTISHVGVMVVGFALLDARALSGIAVYVLGHALVKGALFLCAGILLHRCGSVDEHDLRGKAGNLWGLGVLMGLGAIGLCGLPPFATFYGSGMVEETLTKMHLEWLQWVEALVAGMTAAGVFRVTARIFLGWGEKREATSRGAPHIPMDQETAGEHDHTPVTMWAPIVVLLLLAMVLAVPKVWRDGAATEGLRFVESGRKAAVVLEGTDNVVTTVEAEEARLTVWPFVALAVAVGMAGGALFPRTLGPLNWPVAKALSRSMRTIRQLQSGHVGDYVAWFVLGLALYGGVLVWLVRAG